MGVHLRQTPSVVSFGRGREGLGRTAVTCGGLWRWRFASGGPGLRVARGEVCGGALLSVEAAMFFFLAAMVRLRAVTLRAQVSKRTCGWQCVCRMVFPPIAFSFFAHFPYLCFIFSFS